MTDFLDEKRQEIADRLAELRPLVDEYTRLEAAAAALVGVGEAVAPAAMATRRPGRPRRTTTTAASTTKAPATRSRARAVTGGPRRRPGRRKGSGTRSVQALKFVTEQPGISIPELAARMGIKQNYLYRVLPGLEQEGRVAKQGRGWHPTQVS
ncbi:MAG: hypothetical protein ACYCUM_02965 [Solirubrobacteraceae bacterium]